MKKKCICCGIEKDISEYYSHPRTADGHLNKCKECCKKQNKDNREKHLEYYREYDRNRKAKENDTSGGMNMFEKEAEDSFKCKKVLYKWETDKHSYIDGFKDGAKFGYDKANEWHYVKDGNPNNENDILCQISKDEVVVGYYHTVAKRYITIDGQDLYNVIAWKEITLPSLPKEIKEK